MPDTARPTVVIVDDHQGFRGHARALLEADGYCVVGEAADGASGYLLAVELRPDIVVLDVQLPDMDGFEVSRRLAARPEQRERPAVVLISSRDPAAYGPRIATSGARGFVAKDELSGEAIVRVIAES